MRYISIPRLSAIPLILLLVFAGSCNVRGFKDSPYLTPRVVVDTPGGMQAGDVTLTYRLVEVDGTRSDITLYYSTDGGANYLPANAKDGDGTVNLRGGFFPGATHTIVWDSFADGVSGTQTVRVRITAQKSASGSKGTSGATAGFEIRNANFPAISWIARPEGTTRRVPLTFTWKLDTPAVPIQDYYYGLDEDPPASATAGTFATVPAPSSGPHTFRVFAQSTGGLNSAVLAAAFTCDNAAGNQPPSVVITGGPDGTTMNKVPTFEYAGADADGSVTGYYVGIDEDPPTAWTTLTSWTSPVLDCGSHTFHVMAQDNEGANSSAASRSFDIEPSIFSPFIIGNCDTPDGPEGVAVRGDYLIVADGYPSTMHVIDISVKANPFIANTCNTGSSLFSVRLQGQYAYIVGGFKFSAVDISNPLTPFMTGQRHITGHGGSTIGCAVEGNYGYMGFNNGGVWVIDISDPYNLFDVGYIGIGSFTRGVWVVGDSVYLADVFDGLQVVDVSVKTNPTFVNSFLCTAIDVEVYGGIAYVSGGNPGLKIIDVSNPQDLTLLGECTVPSGTWGLTVVGNYVYTVGGAGLTIIDISDKANPCIVTIVPTPGKPMDVTVEGMYAYVADGPTGITIIKLY